MSEVIDLKYVGICISGPWMGQEVRAEMPCIVGKSGLPEGSQYFHENGVWYFETPETMAAPANGENAG